MSTWSSRRAISSLFSTKLKTHSSFELNNLLQLCCDSRVLNQGKQVHEKIVHCGLDHHPFLLTKLVQMYAECDDLVSARNLFDKLSQPNVFAWTAILGFYSRHGMFRECLKNYFEMSLRGIVPDGYVFPKVLRACAQCLCLEVGKRVHKDVIVYGSEFNIQVCNSLIDMYSKCCDIQSARGVFEEMVGRDLLSWNSMISGYVSNGLFEFAVELFGDMRSGGCEPDIVTWNTVMDAYCQMGLCDDAWKIFEQIKEPNIISWTTLISGYSRIDKHDTSLKIFRKMMKNGIIFPDLDSLSSVLVSCRHLGALLIGKEIHGYGIKIESGISLYNSAGPALLTMYAKCGKIEYSRNVFESMDKDDVVAWNAMIVGFIDLGLGHLALEYFSKMLRMGIKNDQTTISTILPACDLKSGKQIHAFINKNSFDLGIPVSNALIHMYSICGCIKSAYSVFSKMITKDLVSWNAMINGFGTHGLGLEAIQLLQQMTNLNLCPDSVTFTSVLSACSHSGLVNEGLQLFYSLTKDFGLPPKMQHFACAVDLLARAGRLEDAVNFIQRMPFKPDRCIWGAILAACREHQNVIVAKLAAEELIKLDPEHAGNYVALSNIYAGNGRWNDAVSVRKEMEVRGLLKPSGQSWIDSTNLGNEYYQDFQTVF